MANKRGRKKGYCPYVSISYEALGDYLGRKGIVKVSRAWLEELGYTITESQGIVVEDIILEKQTNTIEEESKIEYKLTHFE